MKVYVVTEETGEYSGKGWGVVAVFDNRAAADRYVANMAALPGIVAEYGQGSENRYEVVESEVWADAPQRVMRFHKNALAGPGELLEIYRREPYRTETYYPFGYEGDIHSRLRVDGHSPDWCDISVTATSAEQCMAEVQRLYAEWMASP